jgi:ArsR family transcriptional regulator, arsenate/arsenite/antimonite-responsive transcriptional repressor
MREIADVFKALSDPTRLRIAVLLTHGELCVCDLMEVLGLPQSTISRHMSRLKSAGMVNDHRQGKWIHYSLANGGFPENIRRFLTKELAVVKPHRSDLKNLEKYLVVKDNCQ